MNKDTLADLTTIALNFRDERDWKQFHHRKDLAICLTLEAAEVLELVLWKSTDELNAPDAARDQAMADELSDVLHAVLLLAEAHQIDLGRVFREKMLRNAIKYPVEKSRGVSTKYTDL